jgi:hypothetical protein
VITGLACCSSRIRGLFADKSVKPNGQIQRNKRRPLCLKAVFGEEKRVSERLQLNIADIQFRLGNFRFGHSAEVQSVPLNGIELDRPEADGHKHLLTRRN